MEFIKPKVLPPLDNEFLPAVLSYNKFLEDVKTSQKQERIIIALERENKLTSHFETQIFKEETEKFSLNFPYVEKIVKSLLWLRGGFKVTIAGPEKIGEYIKKVFSKNGKYSFDVNTMEKIYEKKFVVEITDLDHIPPLQENPRPLGHNLSGYRIGFDLGASDFKVAAVVDGKEIYSEEIVWHPKEQVSPKYHYDKITQGLKIAASKLPRVDAIGGSSAGVYINNRVMIASIFRGIPEDIFEKEVKDIFLKIKNDFGNVPFEIINDGDVTALAGSMSLGVNSILGIALGSSQAGGYINKDGLITGWLNELAFVPIDLSPYAPVDEWSQDKGCGVQYLSQVAVVRLAEKIGIDFKKTQTPAEKLKYVQNLLLDGNKKVKQIFETIGVYLGYAIANYCNFYDIENVLILGRVTSGEGGEIIAKKSKEVLWEEFPHLYSKITLHLPDEKSRRVGQAIAAASLPVIA